MIRKEVVAIGLVLMLAACSSEDPEQVADSQRVDDSLQSALIARVEAAIEREMEDNNIPGVAVVLVQNGETIFKQGYGVANAETGAPVDPDRTIFRIGSISKALTLLTLTRLVDDGRLDRDQDVAEFVSTIENSDAYASPVTVDHLLTHTTGFDQIGVGRQLGGFEYSISERQAARPSLAEFLGQRNLRRIQEPGEHFRYDTYGTTLAGVILEQITGLSFPDAMRQELFEPLGMNSSSVEVLPADEDRLAKGHGYINGQYVTTPYEIYMTTPASSIDATVSDMGRLLEALTSDGSNRAGRLFSEAMQGAIIAPHYRPRPDFAGMSHGLWEALSEDVGSGAKPVRTLGHGGDMWGFNGSMTLIPELGLAFYVVANRNNEGGGTTVKIGGPVMRAILETYYADVDTKPVDVPDIDPNLDLSDYAGRYYWPVYCHICSDAEFTAGGWRRPDPVEVVVDRGRLLIRGDAYVPLGEDLFVDAGGYSQVYFKRNDLGEVTSYSFKDNTAAFEKERSSTESESPETS
ncbi:MAG: serine hydrolase domain-containing protein [Pseudomonadota bacterium]